MLPRTHVIRVWWNQHNRYEAQCTCQWGAVTSVDSRMAYFLEGHKGTWVMRGDEVSMEGQDGRGFEEGVREAIKRVTPQPEPASAPETGPGPETVGDQVKKAGRVIPIKPPRK